MNKQRLTTLADFLETVVPDDQFDINNWIGSNCQREPLSVGCGTTGCAVGWCPTIWPADWVMVGSTPLLTCATLDAFESAMQWFDISEADVDWLFMPGSYNDEGCEECSEDPCLDHMPDRMCVVARIRELFA